jgi:hypothetical protein
MDLAIQRRESDLVVGTHGRGVYVIDDLSPLRGLSDHALAAPLHLFPVADAQQYRVAQTGSSRFPGAGEYRGANEPYGALVTFAAAGTGLPHPDAEVERQRRQARRTAGEGSAGGEDGEGGSEGEEEGGPKAEIEIRNAAGEVVRSFEVDVHQGINRAVWDLTRDAFDEPEAGDLPRWREPSGPEVVPGDYAVTVRLGDAEAEASFSVLADPRFDVSAADRRAKQDALLRLGTLQETLTAAIGRLRRTADDTETALRRHAELQGGGEDDDEEGTSDADDGTDLKSRGEKLLTALEELELELWTPPGFQGIPAETRPWDHVGRGFRLLSSDWQAPTAAQRRYLEIAEEATAAAVERVNAFFAAEVAPFRQQVRDAEIELLPEEEPLAMP